MAARIKIGYCDLGSSQFKDGQWLINGEPVAQQVRLAQYPCYALSDSELGNYVCVIGDTEYRYVNPTVKSASKLQYTYQDNNPSVLDSLWLVEYMDAFYIAVKGTFDERAIASVIPVAFNAYDMELYLQELHLYIDIEDTTVLGTIVVFDTSIQASSVHFYANRADCENICSVCVNTVLSRGILTSLTPNITGYEANMSTSFVEEMGVVDIHLTDDVPTAALIQQICTQACTNFRDLSKKESPNGYCPAFRQVPVTPEPEIIPANIDSWSKLMTVTTPSDDSITLTLCDFVESVGDDYDDEEYDLMMTRWHKLICIIAMSQVCGFTAQDYSINHFQEWISSSDFEDCLEDCLKHDFLFPDAIAFYSESGVLLHGEDYVNIEAIMSGEYATAIYDKVATACGSPFTLEYAKMMQTRRKCFKDGRSNRATLPSRIPFATFGFGRDVALLYFAYMGILDYTYLPAVNKYVLWDYLCTGPYLIGTLAASGCARVSRSSENPDWVRASFSSGDRFLDYLAAEVGKKTDYNNYRYNTIGLSSADLTKLKVFETSYTYTAVDGDNRVSRGLQYVTLSQWYLLSCNLVALADAFPRGLNSTEIHATDTSLRAVLYVVNLWLRAVLGTIEEASDPVCKYAPFQSLSPKELWTEWMLPEIGSEAMFLPCGWEAYNSEGSIKEKNNRFIMRDVRGRHRVWKGYDTGDSTDPYKIVKECIKSVLSRSNRGGSSTYQDYIKIFLESEIYLIPALYEFGEAESIKNLKNTDDNLGTVLMKTLPVYTISVMCYTQKTVNALLALSDVSNPTSFFNQYISTLKLFNSVLKPLFQVPNENQFRAKLALTVCYIQCNVQEYTLTELTRVLQTLNLDTAWRDMLNQICPGGNSSVTEMCSPPKPEIIRGKTPKMNADLESLLSSLDNVHLDEEESVEEKIIVNPIQRMLGQNIGLQELQPRRVLLKKWSETRNNGESVLSTVESQLESGLNPNEAGLDNLLSELDDFLSGDGTSVDSAEVTVEQEPVFDDIDAPLVDLGGGLSALEAEYDTSIDLTALGASDDEDTLETVSGEELGEITGALKTVSDDVLIEEASSGEVSSDEASSGEVLSDEAPSDEVSSDEAFSDEVSSDEVSEQPSNDIEYLYNSASPDSTAILIRQIATRQPQLAFKLLAIIPIGDEGTSELIEPTIGAVTAYCDKTSGYCYFDKDDALRVNASGIEYYVLQVNNAERRARNALANGMLTYKYYGTVLPKVLGSTILT